MTHVSRICFNDDHVVAIFGGLFYGDFNWLSWSIDNYLWRPHVVAVVNHTTVATTKVRLAVTEATISITFTAKGTDSAAGTGLTARRGGREVEETGLGGRNRAILNFRLNNPTL